MRRKRFPVLANRALVLVVTGLFWLVWLYLLAPLASLLLWFAGVRIFSTEMFDRGGYVALEQELSNYGAAALGILCAVAAWVIWNKKRYGNRNTRTIQPLYVRNSELAEFSGLRVPEIRKLQASKQATVFFDGSKRLLVRHSRGKVAYKGDPEG